MKKKFFITTPIFYANAKPHIGHAYATVMSDVLARFHRQSGENVFFSTGTDEHGAKIATKAEEMGENVQSYVDQISELFMSSWKNLNISNDGFIRTTNIEHKKAVQKALQFMFDKGDIYLGKYDGLYCRGCEQFKNEKDLIDGKCPDHMTTPEVMSEDTYMFRMSKYADELIRLVETNELLISPDWRRNEILNFLREGLHDISFSRKNIQWGIPLPWDTSHTAYVWADAFLNYLTVLDWKGDPESLPIMWPADLHIMSKDILRVHSTIWPAMLLSLGIPVQKQIFVHGFFLVDGQKMSKSIGNVISPEEMVARFGLDASRYLLATAAHFGDDVDISWKKLDDKYTADLVNGFGNLVARVSTLLEKNQIETNLRADSDFNLKNEFNKKIDSLEIDSGIALLMAKVKECDELLSEKTPWKMTDKQEIFDTLLPIAQNILNIAILISPIMPVISESVIRQFSEKQIKKGDSLFPRLQINSQKAN